MSNNLFTISETARRVGVSESTLRTYDARGIVRPVRDSAGRRLFSESDVQSARQYRIKRQR